jgi:hypothetical protein
MDIKFKPILFKPISIKPIIWTAIALKPIFKPDIEPNKTRLLLCHKTAIKQWLGTD